MKPLCQFCLKAIKPKEGHAAIYDDGWCHELCWWKRECARLQAEVDQLKDAPTGSIPADRRIAHNHSLASEPTQYGEFEETKPELPTEAGEPCDD